MLAVSVGNEVPADIVRVHGIGAVEDGRGWYRIERVDANAAAIARLAAWAAERGLLLRELRADGGTLEERYLALTGERGTEDEG